MLVNKDNEEYYIKSMARHYKKSEEQIRKEMKENKELLEGYAEYLNDLADEPTRSFRHYGSKYYE